MVEELRIAVKPVDIGIAVLVAVVVWELSFVASRIALDEFSPELMTTLRLAGMRAVIGGIAVMLFAPRPQALGEVA